MNTKIFHFYKYGLEGHKRSFREFKKILRNTYIYELILIKIYMKTIFMNTKIFNFNKNDLKGH